MANSKEFKFTVITPDRKVLDETTTSVVIPAHDGEIGILVDRAPLLCELGVGQLRYDKGGTTRFMVIDGGFAQVSGNSVTVLTNTVVTGEEVSEKVISAARAEAAKITGNSAQDNDAREHARRRVSALEALNAAK